MREMPAVWREFFYSTDGFKKAIPGLVDVIMTSDSFKSEPIRQIAEHWLLSSFSRVHAVVEMHSESPIETFFLQTLGALAIGKLGPQYLWFDGPTDNIETLIAEESAGFQSLESFFDEFGPTGPSPNDIKQMGLSPKEAEELTNHVILHNLTGKASKGYHVNLQARFPATINVEGKRIRADMVFWKPRDPSIRIVVECDGFAYHKERESFVADRKRDRVLKAHGYDVIRFSGPEIHNDATGVATELLNYLEIKEAGHG